MTAISTNSRASARFSDQARTDWPDAVLTIDPDLMHPRAIAMADQLREGVVTFRGLIGAGFTAAEITEFLPEAKALATSLSIRQSAPGVDLLAELVAKACAAISHRRPTVRGGEESEASYIAWSRYCQARNAYVIDPWAGQRERCLDLLRIFFRTTPIGEVAINHILHAVAHTMEARH
ncbi:hypothetical protein [Shinella sp. NM-101]|uniref:hypothetical protein n=1 Tax=Shinella sp. NM-101 TaxID=2744455 RepID=UPI001F34C1EF|nr:hypothetical protein [Shinella sp. NM-101]